MVSLTICYPPVFLDENNTVKMTSWPFKSTRTGKFREHGVRHCPGPIPAYTHLFLKDSILHIT